MLILVMVLLGVLFVTGVAFLASMNFQSEMISVRRQRDVRQAGISAVRQRVDSILREGMTTGPTSPLGGSLDEPFLQATDPKLRDPNASPIALGELPGVHNLTAPIDPYRDYWNPKPAKVGALLFSGITDLVGLASQPFNGSLKREASEIVADWIPGVEVRDPDLGARTPVDADGDGVSDAIQFDLRTLGFSQSRIDDLAAMVNPSSNPDGRVFLGLRIVSHGGMVNLNDSNPTLIANVLDIRFADASEWMVIADRMDAEYRWFRHRPTTQQSRYSPQSEEAMLRRRGGLLPPRVIAPSLLQGNTFAVDPEASADLPILLPPVLGDDQDYEKLDPGRLAQHRFAPIDFFEPFDAGDPDGSAPLWAVRMTPFEGFVSGLSGAPATLGFYDRRHLLTTVSHDDLLCRGGRVEEMDTRVLPLPAPPPPRSFDPPRSGDLRQRMIEVNATADDPDICPGDVSSANGVPPYDDDALPFEYADYPFTILNEGCACPTDPNCRRDPRKGRLELSLPWLDRNLPCETLTDPTRKRVCMIQRQRLIYDAFYMLVRNAKGPYWEEIDCTTNPGACVAIGEDCLPTRSTVPPRSVCHDPVTGQTHREALIARTAASLTANMLDYVDKDDVPTRVAIRSFDFRDAMALVCRGGANHGRPCMTASECPNGECIPGSRTLGREINLADVAQPPRFEYVYGLERQPYITEVATASEKGQAGPSSWAIELFNPYDVPLGGDNDGDGLDDFWLVIGKSGAKPEVDAVGVKLDSARSVFPGKFAVYASPGDSFGLAGGLGITTGAVYDLTATEATKLTFSKDDVVYLVRRVQYPTDTLPTDIVVDQFRISGERIAQSFDTVQVDCVPPPPPVVTVAMVAMERAVPPEAPWKAPVPFMVLDADLKVDHCGTSLAKWNTDESSIRPVEVNFANTGRFNLDDPATKNPDDSPLYDGAFPTTGSMLLLMRHANRSLADYRLAGDPKGKLTDLAFTTWLDDTTTVPTSSGSLGIEEYGQIDNGRMPVFDAGKFDTNPGGKQEYAHHVSPASDPEVDPVKFDPNDTRNRPGRLMHLPWGQLVFDYFTALPLSSLGPYANPNGDPSFVVDLNAPPRVDMTGMRVHGRIDINAAPWKVLAGLPMIPAWRLPAAFRDKIGSFAGLDTNPSPPPGAPAPLPTPIGDQLAQAMVAYREAREVVPPSVQSMLGSTGNDTCEEGFDVNGNCIGGGRGWISPSPRFRRGTGFLTVGELANARYQDATKPVPKPILPAFRIDSGNIDGSSPDFVAAAAKLIALTDWETVRSHVFTVYGVLRGDVDPDKADPALKLTSKDLAADVDRRAIRFEETLDRLPTFLGSQAPRSIGPPVVARYIDTRDD